MTHPTDRATLQWKRDQRIRPVNRWPGGDRTLPCLRYERPMVSRGKHERLCATCRAGEE